MQTHAACAPPTTVAVGLCSGLTGGILACCTLAALKHPITLLLKLQPEVLHEATPYWWIRVAITPLVLLNMTLSGILQVASFWLAASFLLQRRVSCLYCMGTALFAFPSWHCSIF